MKLSTSLAPLLWLSTLALASADEVHLKSGPRLVGRIVESTPQHIVIRVAETGDVTVRQGDIRKIVKKALPEPPPAPKPPEPPAVGATSGRDSPPSGPEAPPTSSPVPAPAPPPPAPTGTPVEVILRKLDAVAATLQDSSKKLEAVARKIEDVSRKLESAAADDVETLVAERRALQAEQQGLLDEQQKPQEEQQKLGEELVKLGPSAAREMIDRLDKAHPAVVGSLVNAIVRIHPEDAVAAILPKIKSDRASARAAAATLLGILGKRFEGEVVKREVKHVESNLKIEREPEAEAGEGADPAGPAKKKKKGGDKNGGGTEQAGKEAGGGDKKKDPSDPLGGLADDPLPEGSTFGGGAGPATSSPAGAGGDVFGETKAAGAEAATTGKEIVDDRAVAALRELVTDKEASVRAAAVAGLGSLHDADSVEAVVEALVDAEAEVRVQALVALPDLVAHLSNPSTVPQKLVDLMEREDAVDRKKMTLKALEKLAGKLPADDDRVFRAIAALITHENEGLRAQALMTLGAVAPAKAVPLLIERLAAEPDSWSRIQILNALIQAHDLRAVPAVLDILERDPADRVRDAAVRTLHAMAPVAFGKDVLAWRNWWKEFSGKKEAQ